MKTHRNFNAFHFFRASALVLLTGTAVALLPVTLQAADLPTYPPPKPDPGPTPEPGPPQACVKPAPGDIVIDRSLVVHDHETLKTGFEFSKTIGAILTSANLPADQAAKEAFVKTLLSSLQVSEQTNTKSTLRTKLDPRPSETAMLPMDLLNPGNAIGLVPIGLFNRLDLAPKSLSDCGEYRIVYSFKAPLNPPFGRFFIIFEAKLPNPDTVNKAAGQLVDPKACVAVAKFWSGLSSIADEGQRNSALQKFYYEGLSDASGPIIGPVVNATNYGDPLGQVRGNQFVDSPWMLREWRIQVASATGKMEFNIDTVKSNPLKELYDDNVAGALDPGTQDMVRQNFQAQLLSKYVKEIVKVDQAPGVNAMAIINGFGIRSDIREFDEFQSESQSGGDVPAPVAALKTQMVAAIPGGVSVNADELLVRLNAITCQGCHETARGSVGRLNRVVVNWPADQPFSFVHIHEPENGMSALSPALTTQFLPSRRFDLIEGHCPDPAKQTPLVAGGAVAIDALHSRLNAVRGSEALPGAEAMQQIESSRESIRRQSEQEAGFFIDVRRPH